MKNVELKKNVKYFIENVLQIISISKGNIGGVSIDIITDNPLSSDSYLYKDKINRDDDFEEIIELTNFKK